MASDKKFSVLMISSEAVPFAKSGGLGDVVTALSSELRKQGHDVRIIMPRYYSIDRDKLNLLPEPLGVPIGFGQEWAGVYSTVTSPGRVPVYFIEHEMLFGRKGIYGPSEASEFPDNARRFTFLCRAAFQLCRKLHWIPEIMHAHDWPGGLVPVYLYTWEQFTEFQRTASVFTIHNLGYQGVFDKTAIHFTQLRWEHFHGNGFEFHDQLNFLQAGIKNADIVTTVSPTYAEEIQTSEFGFQMDGILRHRKGDLFGILNGIDYSEWNPESDPYIPYHYNEDDPENKKKVKAELQKLCGFPPDTNIPVIGMVSRLVDQKGIGALCGPSYGSLYNICSEMAVQAVILGTGEKWCEEELRALEQRLPNLKVFLHFDNMKAHLIEAGSDFFLMPSKYEPCGLNQLYSLRYGTLPIVRRTGGLADSVENYSEATGEGTGFMFEDLTPRSIYDVTGWAVWAWYNRQDHIAAMRVRAMKKRFSWEKSAAQYAEIYQWACDRRRGVFERSW